MSNKTEIGGYFEVEFSNVRLNGLYNSAVRLNTARNCLEYILRVRGYKKINLPYYVCGSILEPLKKLGIKYSFYHIDKNFEPLGLDLNTEEGLLYVNYFGIKNSFIKQIGKLTRNLIIDNSQALFAEPLEGVDTFYSLRKFMGVADGAFLFCNKSLESDFEIASSNERSSHLYTRKDLGAEAGYEDFKQNEESLAGLPILKMSPSTENILKSYDFDKNRITRERNYFYLHRKLDDVNQLKLNIDNCRGPLCYPFLTGKSDLKKKLISRKIYIPTYWIEVLEFIKGVPCEEHKFITDLVCLPIDHRYSVEDMESIVEIIGNG